MSDYFLHVDLLVAEENAKRFEAMVAELVRKQVESEAGAFFAANWQLKLALRAVEPLPFQSSRRSGSEIRVKDERLKKSSVTDQDGQTLCRSYTNLWNVPDPPDIALVMQKLADDSVYSGINAAVVREIQNLVLAIQAFPSTKVAADTLSGGEHFIQIRRQFETKDLGPYLFTAGALIPSIEKAGWRSFGHYQNVTGHLNVVTELWKLPNGVSKDQELTALLSDSPPGVQELVRELVALPKAEWHDILQPYIEL